MSLFVDGNISTIEDLRAYDSSLLTVSNVEQVDLIAKLSLAQRELQVELQQMFAVGSPSNNVPISLAAILPMTPASISLGALVVTEPLRQWHSLRTLSMVYRDAYYSQLNDRYQGKWHEFVRLDARTSAILFNTGLGIVNDPIPLAQAPAITVGPGSNGPATYYVRVAWASGSQQEGQASVTQAVIADQFHSLTVQAVNPPPNAVSWNIYAGKSDSILARQNTDPLAIGAPWDLPASGLVNGPGPSEGQAPDYFYKPSQLIQRG
jgi:hypothetical protein